MSRNRTLMATEAEQVFHKLSELSETLGVETSVLRFWEKEFEGLIKPLKVGPRKRLYRPRDLEVFREIKRLLYEERFTIAGARKRLGKAGGRQGRLFEETGDRLSAASAPPDPPFPAEAEAELRALRAVVAETRRDLQALRQFLAPEPVPTPPPALDSRPPRTRPTKGLKSKKSAPDALDGH